MQGKKKAIKRPAVPLDPTAQQPAVPKKQKKEPAIVRKAREELVREMMQKKASSAGSIKPVQTAEKTVLKQKVSKGNNAVKGVETRKPKKIGKSKKIVERR